MRSRYQWLTWLCNSHLVSPLAALFIDFEPETSTVNGCNGTSDIIWSGPARQFSVLSIFVKSSLLKIWAYLSLSYSVTKVHCDKPSTYKVKCLRNQKNARHTLLCISFEHDVITGRVTVQVSLVDSIRTVVYAGAKYFKLQHKLILYVWYDARIGLATVFDP